MFVVAIVFADPYSGALPGAPAEQQTDSAASFWALILNDMWLAGS